MKKLIKIVLENKEHLDNIDADIFVKRFNEIKNNPYEAKDYETYDDGGYSGEGTVEIVNRKTGDKIYRYDVVFCSCYYWGDHIDGNFNIVADILGDSEFHECKEEKKWKN
jgi:hypothetical protein